MRDLAALDPDGATHIEASDCTRPCGSCQLCCLVLAVPELGKGAGVHCTKLVAKGCGIHGRHPAACRGFACSWAVGDTLLSERPDRSGVLVWWEQDVVRVHEVRPGALEQHEIRAALQIYAIGFCVRIERADGSRTEHGLPGPPPHPRTPPGHLEARLLRED